MRSKKCNSQSYFFFRFLILLYRTILNDYQNKIITFWTEYRETQAEFQNLTNWWDLGKKYIKDITIRANRDYNRKRYNVINNLKQRIKRHQDSQLRDVTILEDLENQLAHAYDTIISENLSFIDLQKYDNDEKPNQAFFNALSKKTEKTYIHHIFWLQFNPDFSQQTTFCGRLPLVEGDLWWKTRQTLIEDNLS